MPLIERVDRAAWRTGPWANGGGTTHELVRWDDPAAPAGPPLARLSLAEIDRPGPFSVFAGHDRWLAVVDDGGGLALDLPSGARTLHRHEALAFSGDDPVGARPTGPALVCNLIVRRGIAWRARVVTAIDSLTAPYAVVAVVAPVARLGVELDGHATFVPAHGTLIATASTPTWLRLGAGPTSPAIVIDLDLAPVGTLGPAGARAAVELPAPPVVAVTIDGRALTDWPGFHAEMAHRFGFPDFYGRNLDAWIDCLTSLDDPDAGMTRVHAPRGGVVVLELDHADAVPAPIWAALVDAAAFVNWRRRERGHSAVLALSFRREAP